MWDVSCGLYDTTIHTKSDTGIQYRFLSNSKNTLRLTSARNLVEIKY